MARTERSQWTEAYRKRIERAEAKAAREGRVFVKSQARGHTSNEYQQRKQHKIAKALGVETLSSQQRGQITRFWKTVPASYRTKSNLDRFTQEVEARGFEWFQKIQKARSELRRTAHRRPRGTGVLEATLLNMGITPDDNLDFLLYYNG